MGNTYNPQTGKIDRVVSKLPDEKIIIDHVTGATCKTLEDYINKVGSAGIVAWENGGVTDVGSATIDIDAGSALFRTSNDHDSPLVFGDWAARTGVSLTDNSDNYIIAEYNAGSPQVIVSTSNTANYHDKILLATVYKDGTGTGAILHINQYFKQDINDAVAHIIQRFIQQAGFSRESGALLSGSNLNIAITQGVFWLGLNRFLTNAFDSSVSDTFTYFWRDGSGGWTHLNGQSQINATRYDDGTGGSLLPNGVLGTNRYGVHWVYLETDSEVAIVYGRGNYLIKDAEAAEPPSDLPPEFGANHGIFIGKIIVQEGATTLHSVESSFTVTFSGSSGVTSHLDLTDIGVNTHPQIDSHIADSTIHYTQASISITESQISDLQDYLLVDGTRAMTGNLNMGSNSISSVANITALGSIGNTSGSQSWGHSASGELTTGLANFSALGTIGNAEGVRIYKDSSATFLASEEFFQVKTAASGSVVFGVSQTTVDSYVNFDVTGNITLTGTVDGRDIATDGTTQDSHIADSTIHFTQASISITESQISDLQDYLLIDGTISMTGALNLGTNNITNVGTLTTAGLATLQSLALSNVSTTKVLFMFGNDVVGDANFTYNNVTDTLNVPDTVVTGNITVTGTVDGVDVAALGASIKAHDDVYDSMAPLDGQVLTWDDANSRWDAATPSSGGWELTGNAGINEATDFVGTTDAKDLILKANSVEYLRLDDATTTIITTPDISMKKTKKLIFNSDSVTNPNSCFIDTSNFFGTSILRTYGDLAVRTFLTNTNAGGTIDWRLQNSNQSFIWYDANTSGNQVFRIYGDGKRTKGMILSYNGAGVNVGAGGSKKDIFFGVTNANGGLPIPANGVLQRLGISTNSVTTSGKLRLYYSLNGGSWTPTAAELNTTNTWTSIDDTLNVSLTKGDRLQFQYWSDPDSDGNSYAPTSAEPTITVYIRTNE